MPIDFFCTRCGQLLRVDDVDAGREAECPQCGGLQGIPDVSLASVGEAGGTIPYGETDGGIAAGSVVAPISGTRSLAGRSTLTATGVISCVYGGFNLLLGAFLFVAGDWFLQVIRTALEQQPDLDGEALDLVRAALKPTLMITACASVILGLLAPLAGIGMMLQQRWSKPVGIGSGVLALGLGLVSCLIIGLLTVVHFGYGCLMLAVLLRKQTRGSLR